MGNKKLKQDLFEKVSVKLKEALKEISPATEKQLGKTVKNSAKKISGRIVKALKKSEKTAAKQSKSVAAAIGKSEKK